MFSKKTKYALHALMYLAKHYNSNPDQEQKVITISEISEEEHISKKFLESILLEFRKIGVLGSRKGIGGGYYFIKNPKDVKISTVLRLTDGPISLTPCVSLNFYEPCEECKTESTCAIREVATKVRDATLGILAETSLADLINRSAVLEDELNQNLS